MRAIELAVLTYSGLRPYAVDALVPGAPRVKAGWSCLIIGE